MPNLEAIELKAFVPAQNFQLSKEFYSALGFELKWSSEAMAYFAYKNTSFLLQNFYVKEHAENYMMHLLVENVDDWWNKLKNSDIEEKFGIDFGYPDDRDWGIRDFAFLDPSGVAWRIGQDI